MLGAWAPSLEELYAADNNVSDVAELAAASSANGNKRVDGFRRLKSLDLSETELSSWGQVCEYVVCWCVAYFVDKFCVVTTKFFSCSFRVCHRRPRRRTHCLVVAICGLPWFVDLRFRLREWEIPSVELVAFSSLTFVRTTGLCRILSRWIGRHTPKSLTVECFETRFFFFST